MEGKEEISDTDSGIILHSGPDSPFTIMKDVITHTRAVKLKHQSLEDRLELCLLELKKLCIREAELTGRLSADYPVLPGEKPHQIRQRIGAAFKQDEQSISQGAADSELNSVEAELSLQLQIYKAARRLCHEEHLSKAQKTSRLQQCKREEKKVKQLQTAFQLHLQHGRSSPRPGCISTQRGEALLMIALCPIRRCSMKVRALLGKNDSCESCIDKHALTIAPEYSPSHLPGPSPHKPAHTTPTLEELQSSFNTNLELEAPPIEHSPWTESSLDQPYQKTKNKSHSCSSNPAVTPVLPPVEACYEDTALPLQFSHLRLCPIQSNSAPSTPEMHLRRQFSLRLPNSEPPLNLDKDRGRTRVPRRLLTEYVVTSPGESPIQRGGYRNHIYHSSSETKDSNSEHSAPSYTSSLCREMPCDLPWQCQPTYRYQSSPNDNHGPMAYPPGPGFYQNHQHQSTPSFHRGYYDHGMVYPSEMDMARLYHGPPPPCHSSRYEHWYEEAPVHPQRALKSLSPHVRLSRAPSLRECPHHPSRGFPRQVVNEELKSWHQRNQFRPHSLDRQTAIRLRNVPGCESPLSHHHKYPEQAPQRRVLQKAADGTPEQWFVGDESELISQV
ncbi:unnamed protein product [Oncorhynchus mykiss]|uniref:Cytohesin Ubiquitin Protein Inducing domain-containing protein n=1 Tax=Oncorhynchus mykiss TaxID=8022 RepID=A0A060WZP4_ONCMY|nr:unnamed protein product [Oncorhynchus mykiss]